MIKYYVAATSQHVGKTTSTLGLVKAFKSKGFNVGYCKPVGQKALGWRDDFADKDAVLFSQSMDFNLDSTIHSPVILGPGATIDYIDHPEKFRYRERILHAASVLEQQYEAVIYEGTGHPGVGSVVDLSNAAVAKLLNAEVILIVEGGIGSTIDEIAMSSALFQLEGVPIAGYIINKVQPEKLDKIKTYLEKKLNPKGPPVLGYLPYDRSLANPIMDTISHAIKGEVLYNPGAMDNRVENTIAGSLLEVNELGALNNILLVSSSNRMPDTLRKMMGIHDILGIKKCPLAGIIITGDGTQASEVEIPKDIEDYIYHHRIPVVSTLYDTYGSAVKINRIEVKINTRTPWKVDLAEEMIRQHVDLDRLLAVPWEHKVSLS